MDFTASYKALGANMLFYNRTIEGFSNQRVHANEKMLSPMSFHFVYFFLKQSTYRIIHRMLSKLLIHFVPTAGH